MVLDSSFRFFVLFFFSLYTCSYPVFSVKLSFAVGLFLDVSLLDCKLGLWEIQYEFI